MLLRRNGPFFSVGLSAEPVWQLRLPNAGDRILATAVRPLHDSFHSVGDILSDRTVLYKYLNPHMLGLATLSEGCKTGSLLTIYIIDTVKVGIVTGVRGKGVLVFVYFVV